MSQTKKIPKGIILATIGMMIPAVILAIAFFALQSDAKNKAEYDRLRAEQAQRIAEREKAEQAQLQHQQHASAVEVVE